MHKVRSGSRNLTAQAATWALGLALLLPSPAYATAEAVAVEFDPGFLHGSGGTVVDVSRFAQGNPVLPGEYTVDLRVNDEWVDQRRVRFVSLPGQGDAKPCLDRKLLAAMQLDFSALPRKLRQQIGSQPELACIAMSDLSPQIAYSFDQSIFLLAINIPQSMVRRSARGSVAPELWVRGVPSATLRYDMSFFHASTETAVSNSAYLRLDSGINVGGWHLRQRSVLNVSNDLTRFQGIATYLMRDLPEIQSRLIIGDSYTDGAIFDSLGFRGVSLGTDDRMSPQSQSGYAPIVRGIARTTARVRIMQNGVLLLETNVSPGPFLIDDLFPTGYGGDLEVTVHEADGAEQNYKVPFTALPQLIRPGRLRYNLAGGEYREPGVSPGGKFVQGTVQYGVNNALTAFAGAQFSSRYRSGLVGTALNTPLGAIAVDATLASTRLPGGSNANGLSLRASYSKDPSRLANDSWTSRLSLLLEGILHSAGGDAAERWADRAQPAAFARAVSGQREPSPSTGIRQPLSYRSADSVLEWLGPGHPGASRVYQRGPHPRSEPQLRPAVFASKRHQHRSHR